MMITVFPFATSVSKMASSFSKSLLCKPVLGSSRIYTSSFLWSSEASFREVFGKKIGKVGIFENISTVTLYDTWIG